MLLVKLKPRELRHMITVSSSAALAWWIKLAAKPVARGSGVT